MTFRAPRRWDRAVSTYPASTSATGRKYERAPGRTASRPPDDEERHTLTVAGTEGRAGLVGYDWAPRGVDLGTAEHPAYERHATETGDYVWEMGASLAAECLATGKELLVTPEHALHVVETMEAARKSDETGRRIDLRSSFQWPVVG